MQEALALDATSQAELVRSKSISPSELVTAALERIDALDNGINAVIHRRAEAALAEASSPTLADGPFRGVPLCLKDLGSHSAGDPAHDGSRVLREAGYVAREDSWLVSRFRRAGFVIVGRTNTPELGLVGVTEPESYGPTHNPWDLAHSPGGSSGGSAAAVAAGMVALASGGDGGGSIRIPASMCGLVGLKPSRGRISMGPTGDESGLAVKGVLSRSVRDTALALDAIAGPGPGDTAFAPPTVRPYGAELSERPANLRVGFLAQNADGTIHPDCEAAVEHTATLLESLGHHVEPSHPSALDDPQVFERRQVRIAMTALLGVIGLGRTVGRELDAEDVEALTWAAAERARATSAEDYALAVEAGARLTREMAQWWLHADLLLTPTLPVSPPLIGTRMPKAHDAFNEREGLGTLGALTAPFNVTGQPAISLPLWWNSAGLPIGSQLAAAHGREDLLIQVAAQLEEAEPWAHRRPPLGSREAAGAAS